MALECSCTVQYGIARRAHASSSLRRCAESCERHCVFGSAWGGRGWLNWATSGRMQWAFSCSFAARRRTARDTAAASTHCTSARYLCIAAARDLHTTPKAAYYLYEYLSIYTYKWDSAGDGKMRRTYMTNSARIDQMAPVEFAHDLVESLVPEPFGQPQIVVRDVRAERKLRRLPHTPEVGLF